MTINVAVSGALGKMGLEVVKTVLNDSELKLTGVCDVKHVGDTLKQATSGAVDSEVLIEKDLGQCLSDSKAQVMVDFTHPDLVFHNTMTMIEQSVRPVIGTTGLDNDQLKLIDEALKQKKIGGLVAPNFAIGAVLMMKFAREASKYLDHAEIIEYHHNQKADAPSGTSIKTAQLMAESQEKFGKTNAPEKELIASARGANGPSDIRIHSVRLPGFVAHQEVIFGGQGQVLTFRHDSIDRTSFMPGVALSCKKVMELNGLTYGLEHLL